MVEAVRRVAAGLKGRAALVACFDQYPFSLAAALLGINACMLASEDDPDLVRAVMARAHDYALAYGTALAEAGADGLTGGDSPAGLIGPRRYEQLALPAEQGLIAALQAATGKPVSLHICGNAEAILSAMARSGADGLEIDYRTDLALACRTVGPEVALWGNLDPVGVLARGRPESVRAAAQAARAAAKGHPRFILGSGCTLAVETSFANVEAMLA
jgi:MtaA/CmuA family methyltransferase